MLHKTVLVSVAQQSESATCIHMSPYPLPFEPPSHPPYPTPLRHHWAPLLMASLCVFIEPAAYPPEASNEAINLQCQSVRGLSWNFRCPFHCEIKMCSFQIFILVKVTFFCMDLHISLFFTCYKINDDQHLPAGQLGLTNIMHLYLKAIRS